SLDLGGTRITDLGVAELKSIPALRSLNLSETQVTAKALEFFPKIERLSLWRAKRIDDNAAPSLEAMSNLQILDLRDTPVTDKTLGLPAKAPKPRRLYLTGSRVTAAGVESFRKANPTCEGSWN